MESFDLPVMMIRLGINGDWESRGRGVYTPNNQGAIPPTFPFSRLPLPLVLPFLPSIPLLPPIGLLETS